MFYFCIYMWMEIFLQDISFILNKNRKFLFTKIPVYVNKPAGAERIPGLSPGHFPPLLSCQKNNKGQKRGFSKHRAISSSVIFTRLIKSTLYSFSSVLVFTTFSREKWFFSCLMCKIQTFYCLQSSFFLRTLGWSFIYFAMSFLLSFLLSADTARLALDSLIAFSSACFLLFLCLFFVLKRYLSLCRSFSLWLVSIFKKVIHIYISVFVCLNISCSFVHSLSAFAS